MKNIKLIINHDVSFTDDFTKDVLNEFPDEIEDNFIEKFYEIENKYIGLLNTTQNFHSYKYDIEYLYKNYKAITGKNFKAPRSKISWRKY
jgi:hypothetical protein